MGFESKGIFGGNGGGATGGSAPGQIGNLAGLLGGISEAINSTRTTNANTELAKAQATKTLAEASLIGKYGSKETQARINNIISNTGLARASTAKATQEAAQVKGGLGSRVFGTDPDLGNIATTGLSMIGAGGVGKIATTAGKVFKAWKAGKMARGFSKFLGGL